MIILVLSEKVREASEFSVFLKELCICTFLNMNVRAVHPVHYSENFAPTKSKDHAVLVAYQRCVSFLRKYPDGIRIIDNFYVEHALRLLYNLRVVGYPVTHVFGYFDKAQPLYPKETLRYLRSPGYSPINIGIVKPELFWERAWEHSRAYKRFVGILSTTEGNQGSTTEGNLRSTSGLPEQTEYVLVIRKNMNILGDLRSRSLFIVRETIPVKANVMYLAMNTESKNTGRKMDFVLLGVDWGKHPEKKNVGIVVLDSLTII